MADWEPYTPPGSHGGGNDLPAPNPADTALAAIILASPPPFGLITPNAGAFTTLAASNLSIYDADNNAQLISFAGTFKSASQTTYATYNSLAPTGELTFFNNLAGGNTIAVQNKNLAGYNAYIVRDSNNVERMAIGIGNSGTPQSNTVYWECSYYDGTGTGTTPPPGMRIQLTGYMFGSYGQRAVFGALPVTQAGASSCHLLFFQGDGGVGMNWDMLTHRLGINLSYGNAGPTGIPVTPLDCLGAGTFGGGTRGTDASYQLNVISTLGTPNLLRLLQSNVGKCDFQMNGTSTAGRRLDVVNTDNSAAIPLSIALDGSGAVTTQTLRLASTTGPTFATGVVAPVGTTYNGVTGAIAGTPVAGSAYINSAGASGARVYYYFGSAWVAQATP